MLNMSRKDLAAIASITHRTVVDFERGARKPRASTLRLIQIALEEAGIEFISENGGGPGMRMRG